MILVALMVAGAATGCGAKKDTKVESTSEVATNSTKLDEDAIKDTYTGIEDMYVLEGSKDVDYLDGVLYDSSIVNGIDVDSSKVDTSKTGNYKITFSITADRTAYDTFRDAFIKSETVKDKMSTDKTKTDKGSADKTKTETVKVKKDTVVVNKDEAQKLADQNKLVRTDNGETVKKSDGTEVKTEQKAPASTAVTGGDVVDASAKTEVKPETTATPTMDPKEEAKKEESKKDDKKEEGGPIDAKKKEIHECIVFRIVSPYVIQLYPACNGSADSFGCGVSLRGSCSTGRGKRRYKRICIDSTCKRRNFGSPCRRK